MYELESEGYVANSILPKESTKEDIISKFKEIKGTKFSEKVISKAIKELEELELVVL